MTAATPAGVLAVVDAERATLEAQLDSMREELASLRVAHAEEVAAWMAGRAAALTLYTRRLDEAQAALEASETRSFALEAELGGASAAPGDMRRARLGELLAVCARQGDVLRARVVQLTAAHARIARGDVG